MSFGTYSPDYGKPPRNLAKRVVEALKKDKCSIAYKLGYQSNLAGKPSSPGGGFGYNEHSWDWLRGWLDGRDGTYGERPSYSKAAHKKLAELQKKFRGR